MKRENVIELNLSMETGVSKLPGRQMLVRLLGPASAVLFTLMRKPMGELFPGPDIRTRHCAGVARTRYEDFLKNCSTSVMSWVRR